RQRMHAARRQYDALGEAADADAAGTLAHAPSEALGARATAVRRLAGHRAAHEAPAHASAGLPHDAGVLVTEHQGRLPREEPLGGVDVGATDAGRMDGDQDLARPRNGLVHLVEREATLAAPGRDSHRARPFTRDTA